MWAPTFRIKARPLPILGSMHGALRQWRRAQATMSDMLLKRLENNTDGPFDPDSILLILKEIPSDASKDLRVERYADTIMSRLGRWTIAFGRMKAQTYADIVNEARDKNVRDRKGDRLDEALMTSLTKNMDSLTVKNLSYYCTAFSKYDVSNKAFWQSAAKIIGDRQAVETFDVPETVSLFNCFRLNGIDNSVDEKIFTQLGEAADRLLPKLEMNHIPPLLASVCRVPLPHELCSRLLNRLILRWVAMMRTWEYTGEDDEKRRTLVHSVLVSLASPESLDGMRIEETLESFALEVSYFTSQRFEHYKADSLIISLWALQRVERGAKMSLDSLEPFFENACDHLAKSWGLLEDHQSLSLQRLLQLSTVILQKRPTEHIVDLRQRVQLELASALIYANVDTLVRTHDLWSKFVKRDDSLNVAMRDRASELVAEAEDDYDREDIFALFPEIRRYENKAPTAPLPLPEPVKAELSKEIDQDFDKLSAEELLQVCETLAEAIRLDSDSNLPKRLVEAGLLVLEKLERLSLQQICQVLMCFAAANVETKFVVDPLVEHLLKHERLTARQAVDVAECCALLRARTPVVVEYFQEAFDKNKFTSRLSAKSVCRYLRAQARLSLPLSQIYLQRVTELTQQLVPLPREDLLFLLHALLLQGAIPSEEMMLEEIFLGLYLRSQHENGILSSQERWVIAQYVFLLCTTDDNYSFPISKLRIEAQRFIKAQVDAPDTNPKSPATYSNSTLKFRHEVGRALETRKIPYDVDVRWGPGGISVDLWCGNQAWLLDGPECFFRYDGTDLLYVQAEQRRGWLLGACQRPEVWAKALSFCDNWRPYAEQAKGTAPARRLNYLQWEENHKYWIDQISSSST
eukprot:GEMP01011394.1.p1 GENE.GEMP01011394.1~~GEMP01011394.1.p1  ORF type:complete len:861 (+),score=166.46 GEMP01011394.1:29-2611(+)